MGSYLFLRRQRHLHKMLKRYGSIDFSQDVMNIMNEYGNNEDDYDINLGKKKGETNLIVDFMKHSIFSCVTCTREKQQMNTDQETKIQLITHVSRMAYHCDYKKHKN